LSSKTENKEEAEQFLLLFFIYKRLVAIAGVVRFISGFSAGASVGLAKSDSETADSSGVTSVNSTSMLPSSFFAAGLHLVDLDLKSFNALVCGGYFLAELYEIIRRGIFMGLIVDFADFRVGFFDGLLAALISKLSFVIFETSFALSAALPANSLVFSAATPKAPNTVSLISLKSAMMCPPD
jgi:hypothetical protein